MAVKIRLKRMGRKNRPFYRIVAIDSRSRRDGVEIERLGWFDPLRTDVAVNLDEDRVIHWLKQGAQPSETVGNILTEIGLKYKIHLIREGKSEEEIAKLLTEWQLRQEEKLVRKKEKKLAKKKAAVAEEAKAKEAGSSEQEAGADKEEKEDTIEAAAEEVVEEVADENIKIEAEETPAVEETAVEESSEEKEVETVEAEAGSSDQEEEQEERAHPDEPEGSTNRYAITKYRAWSKKWRNAP